MYRDKAAESGRKCLKVYCPKCIATLSYRELKSHEERCIGNTDQLDDTCVRETPFKLNREDNTVKQGKHFIV